MSAIPQTITAVAPLLRRGEITPVDLVQSCFERIDRYESRVHAWAYLDRERAMADAQRLTQELQNGNNCGPLHGIPIGIKDIIDVFDMPTGCGSKHWAHSYARQDAACVAQLRQAGAIILGKTVTTPYAFLDPPRTRNPWNLDRTPGGSSSGSAAAVACGMCYAALGTQTGGSITRPASFCGVYSLKPTHGRVSTEGVLPLAPSLDHVGVMTNCVRDLELLYATLGSGPAPVQNPFDSSIEPRLQNEGATVLPLCVTRDYFDGHCDASTREALKAAIQKLAMGNEKDEEKRLESLHLPAGFSEVLQHHAVIMASEAAGYHQHRLDRHPDDYPVRIKELVEKGTALSGAELFRAYEAQRHLKQEYRLGFRVLITPAAPGVAPLANTTGNAVCNAPWSFLGLPTLSLPYGWSPEGLPLAIQLVGASRNEAGLFQAAAWCEKVLEFPARPLPL